MGLKQRGERRALIAALPGQLDAWEELRAGAADIGRGGCELRFLTSDIRPLRQQFRRQAGSNSRRRDLIERAAGDAQAFRRPGHQRRQRIHVLRQRLPQRWNERPLIGQNALLLRDVEIRSCAGFEALLDRFENAARTGDIALGSMDPVLRGEYLEIGIGDAGERRQRYHIAIEAIRDRGFLRRLRRVAVLAPEIEFIAGAERGRIVDDLAPADAQAAGARARSPGIALRT